MKKYLLCAVAMMAAMPVLAQNYGGYYQQQPTQYQPHVQQRVVQRVYQPQVVQQRVYQQQPVQQVYQQPVYQQPVYQQPVQQVYQQRTYQQPTQARYGAAQSYAGQAYGSPYKPGYSKKSAKKFYVTPRVGFSYTNWLDVEDLNGVGLMGNVAAGIYIKKNLRADLEIGYHLKRELFEEEGVTLDQDQFDFMANLYYDFNNRSKFTPFVGVGVGYAKPEWTLSAEGTDAELSAEADATFSMSASAGVAYELTDMLSLEAMLRGQYVFNEGQLFNLEALTGVRFSF